MIPRSIYAAFNQFQDALTQARRMVPATVQSETDNEYPGRTTYTIRGQTRLAVEIEINRLRETVDIFGGVPGRALFIGPHRAEDGSGYISVGEIVKDQ